MKDLYVHGIVKDYNKSINSLNKYLFSENERLNAIIDELEERISKTIAYINGLTELSDGIYTDYCDLLSREALLELLGGEDICHVEEEKVKEEDK